MQVNIGNSKRQVSSIGFGLMGLTARLDSSPQEESIKVMQYAFDQGATFFNGSAHYGVPSNRTANLDLIDAFFKEYPETKDEIFISIKGAFGADYKPDASPENIRKSINTILDHLKGSGKKVDLFECARVDPKVPIEESIGELAKCVQEGLIDHIGLSEVNANSIRRANAVHPIAAVEVEFSMFTRDILSNGVYDTCRELGIPVVAYSPLGRGVLTGQIQTVDAFPEGDIRRHVYRQFDRFQEENLRHNVQLVQKLEPIAKAKHCTVAQLALAWVLSHEGVIIIPGATKINRIEENAGSGRVSLSAQDLAEIKSILDAFEVKGGRYNAAHAPYLEG